MHTNPTNEKTATAPYNFVPLPNSVYTLDNGIEVNGQRIEHDHFVPETHSGWLDLAIETLTPLFIRGPITKSDEDWNKRELRLQSEPFTTPDGRPLIPGSGLRGMIRTLIEILSFSKIVPVTKEKAFFRNMGKDRVSKLYRKKMICENKKPSGGYVKEDNGQWVIVPAKEVLRISKKGLNTLGLNILEKREGRDYPNWKAQHKQCWFKRDDRINYRVKKIYLSLQRGLEEGTLVLSGNVPNKVYDFVFVGQDEEHQVVIPNKIWQRFHGESQITQWQEIAFPQNEPEKGCRRGKGHLCNGEPVFFLTNDSAKSDENPEGLIFFGRAQMFRFPYDHSPNDLIPQKIKNAGLDLAEAMFGMVDKKKDLAIKGRVFFEDAVVNGGRQAWLEKIIVPRILSSPKITCFQHYLVQNGSSPKELLTYLSEDQAVIRGHKLYWHRWDINRGLDAVKESDKYDELLNELQSGKPKEDSQHTLIQPVKAGVTFNGRIRFENLTDIELGALLCALQLPKGCAHKLGMGKPLGLGTVQIESKLNLIDRVKRYACWENNGSFQNDGSDFIKKFEEAMLVHARKSQEKMNESKTGLQKIARLEVLFHLLNWEKRPQLSSTDYMRVDDFRSRSILPTPCEVFEKGEPARASDLLKSKEQAWAKQGKAHKR